MFSKYTKAFAALLGALTPAFLVSVAALAGFHLDPSIAAGLIGLLSPIAAALVTLRAPANAPQLPPPNVQGTFPENSGTPTE